MSAISAPALKTFLVASVAAFGLTLTSQAVLASDADWETQAEAAIEEAMQIPDSKSNRVDATEVIVDLVIASDGTVQSYEIKSSEGSSFVELAAEEAVKSLSALPASGETKTITVKLSYDTVRYKSTKELRKAFFDKHQRMPAPRDEFVSVDAEVIES